MDKRIEKTILFIAKNFRGELLLFDLAKEIGLSKFHFHRLFKKEIGITPLQYINKLKIEHAAHFLIMYPNSKQLEVAFESGFSSPVEFARTFKRFYNISPMNFRKNKLGEKKIKSQKSDIYSPIEITYLKQQKIPISQTNLLSDNLFNLYKKLIKRIYKPAFSIGFYIDTPMHLPLNECRYFAGLENENITNNQTYFEIEEGYYTYFNIQGDFESISTQIVEYKEQQIDPSPYQIASFIGFEKIKLPINPSDFNYFSAIRTLYLKIKRK